MKNNNVRGPTRGKSSRGKVEGGGRRALEKEYSVKNKKRRREK